MQHINFYRHLEKVVEPPLSARQCLLATFAVLLISLLATAGYYGQQLDLQQQMAELAAKDKLQREILEQLRARKRAEENDPKLKAELLQLASAVRFRRELLASVEPAHQSAQLSFATQLEALARQQLDGIWFTGIELWQGGTSMSLTGRSRRAELLPRYLQKLSGEPVFSGQQFNVLRIYESEQARGALHFEVKTIADDEREQAPQRKQLPSEIRGMAP